MCVKGVTFELFRNVGRSHSLVTANSKDTTLTDTKTPDDGNQYVPKHVGDCTSVVFTFQ